MKHLDRLALNPDNTVCKACNMWTRKGDTCFNCGTSLIVKKGINASVSSEQLELVREWAPEVERGDETGG